MSPANSALRILNPRTNDSTDVVREFKSLSEALCELFVRENLGVKPYIDESLPMFSKLPKEQQTMATLRLRQYHEVCCATLADGYSLKDTPAFAWRMLKKMNLTPKHDLFSHIKEGDVVEFYNLDNVQFFRNMRFFEICSYSIEEIHSGAWHELYERDNVTNQGILNEVIDIFSGKVNDTRKSSVDKHILQEKASAFRFKIEIDLKYLSPITSGGKICGVVAIEDGKVLNAVEGVHSEQLLRKHYEAQGKSQTVQF